MSKLHFETNMKHLFLIVFELKIMFLEINFIFGVGTEVLRVFNSDKILRFPVDEISGEDLPTIYERTTGDRNYNYISNLKITNTNECVYATSSKDGIEVKPCETEEKNSKWEVLVTEKGSFKIRLKDGNDMCICADGDRASMDSCNEENTHFVIVKVGPDGRPVEDNARLLEAILQEDLNENHQPTSIQVNRLPRITDNDKAKIMGVAKTENLQDVTYVDILPFLTSSY